MNDKRGAMERELGFGQAAGRGAHSRFLNRDGSFNVERRGLGVLEGLSPYHTLLTMSWPAFLGTLALVFVALNALFASLYLACGAGALRGPGDRLEGTFAEAFFFSVETLATIGFGNIYPVGLAANALMTFESLVGLISIALATGLAFARFSRPRACFLYSDRALIAPYRDITAFEFRVVNRRKTQVIDLSAKVFLSIRTSDAPDARRSFTELPLEMNRLAFFPLTWTIVHPIDAQSPLAGLTEQDFHARGAEFLITLSGEDEGSSQPVHSRSSFVAGEIIWGARFRSIYDEPSADGRIVIDVRRLSAVEPADMPKKAGG